MNILWREIKTFLNVTSQMYINGDGLSINTYVDILGEMTNETREWQSLINLIMEFYRHSSNDIGSREKKISIRKSKSDSQIINNWYCFPK